MIRVVTIRLVDEKSRQTKFRAHLVQDNRDWLVEIRDPENKRNDMNIAPAGLVRDVTTFLDKFGKYLAMGEPRK